MATRFWQVAALTILSTLLLAATPANPPQTSVVRVGKLSLSLDFDAVFTPRDVFVVRLQSHDYQGDYVVKSAAAPGSKVAKGDVLLELDSGDIDSQLAQAQNNVTIAQANLDKAMSDLVLGGRTDALAIADAQNALDNAQIDLKRWDDNIDKKTFLTSASVDANAADFEVQNATDELSELRKMYKSEDLTNETADIVMKRAIRGLELDQTSAWIAHAVKDRVIQVMADIERQGRVSRVGSASLDVDKLLSSQGQDQILRQTAADSARQALQDAMRKLDELKKDKVNFTVTSPVDGVGVYGSFDHNAWHPIDSADLQPGQKVQLGQILMTVYSPGWLSLNIQCPESQVMLLPPGTKVTVSPTALPGTTYDGACGPIDLVGDTSGSQQLFNVPVALPSVDTRLAPGFKADVNFDGGTLSNVLLVPSSAVWHGKVWVVPDPKNPEDARPQPVQVGFSDGTSTQIKSGLKEGDMILTQAKRPGGGS
jgi:multidrug efflux pump subunit AcrA (membrane-fusion protein)